MYFFQLTIVIFSIFCASKACLVAENLEIPSLNTPFADSDSQANSSLLQTDSNEPNSSLPVPDSQANLPLIQTDTNETKTDLVQEVIPAETVEQRIETFPISQPMLAKETDNTLVISESQAITPYMQVEFKMGYFHPASSTLRHICHGGAIYALEYDVTVWKRLTVFTQGDYFVKKGHSLGEHNRTKIQIGGFSFGLQYDFSLVPWLKFYLGLGPKFFFFRSTDHNPVVKKHISKNGVGIVSKGGFYWLLPRNFYIDTFLAYSYCKIHSKSSDPTFIIPFDINIGGLSLGIGLGYRF